jgi:hypothetical protein
MKGIMPRYCIACKKVFGCVMPHFTDSALYHECRKDGDLCEYYPICPMPKASAETLKRIATGGVCPTCWARTRRKE